MVELLDWRRLEEPAVAGRVLARELRRGAVVGFPTENAYVAAAFGLHDEAVERLGELIGERPLELAVPGLAAARDWLPELGPAGQRLARRFWPGPLTLASGEGVDQGLAGRLPQTTRAAVHRDGLVHLRYPGHEAFRESMSFLSGPVLFAPVLSGEGEALQPRQALESAGEHLDVLIDDGPCRYRQPATAVEVRGESWTIRRPGLVSEELIREQLACLIVFVCTGNTCRSPLAEALCKKRLAERLGCGIEELPARGYRVLSAGMAAHAGVPAADEAREVAQTLGADLSQHTSRPLTAELAAQADYLLAMTGGHLRALAGHFGRGPARLRLLSPQGDDVADPIGQTREVYEACARQLGAYIDALVEELAPR